MRVKVREVWMGRVVRCARRERRALRRRGVILMD